MWNATARQDLKASFDAAISSAYGNGESKELANLAKLFSESALRNYEIGLNEALDRDSAAAVGVAWIDKRPIAKLSASEPGAELGDMLLVVEEYDADGNSSMRACIVEVKQSPSSAIPPVPVTPRSRSTRNQLRVLSEWPTIHGLLATGSNKRYLLENIVTRPGEGPSGVLAQAWYAAVKPRSGAAPFSDPWMAAPAIEGASFDSTLGELFAACATCTSLAVQGWGRIHVGREVVQQQIVSPPGWSQLIDTILCVTRMYPKPPEHFGRSAKGSRYELARSSKMKQRASLMMVMPATLGFWSGTLSTFLGVLCGVLIAAFALESGPSLIESVRTVLHRRGILGRKRFPVLFIQVYHGNEMYRAPE